MPLIEKVYACSMIDSTCPFGMSRQYDCSCIPKSSETLQQLASYAIISSGLFLLLTIIVFVNIIRETDIQRRILKSIIPAINLIFLLLILGKLLLKYPTFRFSQSLTIINLYTFIDGLYALFITASLLTLAIGLLILLFRKIIGNDLKINLEVKYRLLTTLHLILGITSFYFLSYLL